ncbi:3D domain-containing protein [Phycisphaerales bacterium AB-hyl4]|uniref:3D domain-containing protein n=1 Tax=Natronomicrosphaera hydrolytica TaxID=3242702 RepID=A0ABV4U262_9BACT
MPGIFLIGSVTVLGMSALAWGLWAAEDRVGSPGLMSIESRPIASANSASQQAATAVVPQLEIPALYEPQVEEKEEVAPSYDGPTFDGRPLRPAGKMDMTVTAYSPDEQSCGVWADGWTASGYSVWTNGMKLVAADISILPFGSIVSIPGYNNGEPVEVLDVGGAIKGNRLDVLYPTHERALQWGVQRLKITVWEYAD